MIQHSRPDPNCTQGVCVRYFCRNEEDRRVVLSLFFVNGLKAGETRNAIGENTL